MAPRKPKDDDASSTTSDAIPNPAVLKPKTEKAKVTKTKSEEKSKTAAPKAEKPKTKAAAGKKDDVKTGGDGKAGGAGKAKEKAVNGEEAVEIMGKYLRETNRPYSATEISANLHGKVSPFSLPPYQQS
jgi:26S proteasome regulatory subunit, ATPase 3, interacting protein